jgi:leader peptidase (prepilin peptidase)/N-methyltransferase
MRNLLPLVVLTGFGMALSVIDSRQHRLPNRLVAWFTMVQAAAITSLSFGNFEQLLRTFVVATLTAATYIALFLLSRGSLGMGDVKFAFPLGLSIGWIAPGLWLPAIFLGFTGAGLVAAAGLATKRIKLTSHLAFGPYMFAGSLLICAYAILPR